MQGGEVIELASDLGGGKTTFVCGLARGMGSRDAVRSPSFTLRNEYHAKAKGLTLYHFDFYRLAEPGIMRDELTEVLADPKAVVVVEWGDIVEGVLPRQRINIKILSHGQDANSRTLVFTYPEHLEHLLENI